MGGFPRPKSLGHACKAIVQCVATVHCVATKLMLALKDVIYLFFDQVTVCSLSVDQDLREMLAD
jgi:hypothetical protein